MAIFPEWADSVFRFVLFLGLVAVVGLPLMLMAWVRSPFATGQNAPIEQPVKFDHRHHVRDDGIDCLYCHSDARRAPYAGIPATSVCMGCHAQIWTKSPELAPVRESALRGTPITWNRVTNLPQYVFFNHSIHVAKGVGCVSCHGRVDQMSVVYQAEPLLMSQCLDCHRHPEEHVRPTDRVTDMEYVPRGDQRTVGLDLVRRNHISPTTDCTGCHR